ILVDPQDYPVVYKKLILLYKKIQAVYIDFYEHARTIEEDFVESDNKNDYAVNKGENCDS
ncbi:MAG: hypothetical protein GY730_04520, partial [bacterium]|nr:hypothetical protein [bacterium]